MQTSDANIPHVRRAAIALCLLLSSQVSAAAACDTFRDLNDRLLSCFGAGAFGQNVFNTYTLQPSTVYDQLYSVSGAATSSIVSDTEPTHATSLSVVGDQTAYGLISSQIVGGAHRYAISSASSNLLDGTLRVRGTSGEYLDGTYARNWYGRAIIRDTLFIPVAAAFESVVLDLSMRVAGTIDLPLPSSYVFGAATLGLPNFAGSYQVADFANYNNVSGAFDETLSIRYTFTRPAGVVGDWVATTTLSAELEFFGQNGADVDFTNTARLAIGLPAGFAFTSASGVLLTSAVPELPTSLSLFLGIVLLWSSRTLLVRANAT